MTHYLKDYYDLIESKQIVVGYWIKKEIENLIEDLDNPDYIYDTTDAEKRIDFIQTFALQGKAPYYGVPVKLMPFQLAFIEALYSFKMADTKLRRFQEALLEVARKNGKSTLMAALAFYELICAEGCDVCCSSNNDKQAQLIWSEVAGMRYRLDAKKKFTGQNLVELRGPFNTKITRLSTSSYNLDGFNYSLCFIDESHDINTESSELAEALWRSMSTRDEPLLINCTTNGFNRNCYLDKKIEKAKKIINGEREDIRFLPFIYEMDNEAEIWVDERSWEKANPAIRYGVKKIGKLRADVNDARFDTATRIHLLCKDYDMPQSSSNGWLKLGDYDYEQTVYDLEEFRNCICLAAVDLSETTDLSCVRLLFMRPNDPTKYIFSHYWIPEMKLQYSDDKSAGAKYSEWAKQGYLTLADGNDLDVSEIAQWIIDLKAKYGIRAMKVGYDVKFSKDFIRRLDDSGVDTELIPQAAKFLSSAIRFCEADFRAKKINYGSNPIDKWCLGNACLKIDSFNQALIVKSTATKRIDGAVTFAILYATYQRFRTEFNERIK